MEICQFKVYIQKDSLVVAFIDKIAELLRRLTDNPLSSASAGLNSKIVVFLIDSMVKGIAICSLNSSIPVQISEKAGILKTSASTFMENFQKKKYLKNELQIVRCFVWLFSLLHISMKLLMTSLKITTK